MLSELRASRICKVSESRTSPYRMWSNSWCRRVQAFLSTWLHWNTCRQPTAFTSHKKATAALPMQLSHTSLTPSVPSLKRCLPPFPLFQITGSRRTTGGVLPHLSESAGRATTTRPTSWHTPAEVAANGAMENRILTTPTVEERDGINRMWRPSKLQRLVNVHKQELFYPHYAADRAAARISQYRYCTKIFLMHGVFASFFFTSFSLVIAWNRNLSKDAWVDGYGS